jgi:hypothetical protein
MPENQILELEKMFEESFEAWEKKYCLPPPPVPSWEPELLSEMLS